MNYVYILLLQEIPFYVGVTNDPVSRYKQHYRYDGFCETLLTLQYYWLHFNKMCKMQLVYCSEDRFIAEKVEGDVTFLLTKIGFTLVNIRNNRYEDEFTNPYPKLEKKVKVSSKIFNLTYLQKSMENIKKEYQNSQTRPFNIF